MSSKYVKDQFEASWAAKVPTIPLYQTDNEDPDHEDGTLLSGAWATLEYNDFGEEILSLGSPSCRRENGTISVVLSVESGEGSAALDTAGEVIRLAYRNWAVTDLRIDTADPLSDGGFSDGNYYTASVDLSYVYDYYL